MVVRDNLANVEGESHRHKPHFVSCSEGIQSIDSCQIPSSPLPEESLHQSTKP